MRKNREILKWKNNMRALAMVICLALTMQFASGCGTTESAQSTQENVTTIVETFDFAAVPAYDGTAYVAVNDNVPFFTEEELSSASYETYGELDPLGRCTVCVASVGQDLMPAEERGNIGAVKPTGWHTVKYDFVDGKYLYNRCHLIGYQLTGENANEKNLITGTRYLNIEGMLPFENMVADYVKETDQHVMYRVTPVFEGDNLLAAGVLMEGKSVEDNGEGVLFCVCDQPGLSLATMMGLMRLAVNRPGMILVSAHENRMGNPVLWDRAYFSELEELSGDVGGRAVMEKHREKCLRVETREEELRDIDRRSDLF